MKKIIISFVAGIIFAIGLVISGMTNPHVVLGFLDVLGQWNPSLSFVMIGAVAFNLISFHFIQKIKAPFCSSQFDFPQKKNIDTPLVLGSIFFGIGWGIMGVCPGPGIVNIVTLHPQALIFVLCLVIGMVLFKIMKHFTS
jgi:hypothetical protein